MKKRKINKSNKKMKAIERSQLKNKSPNTKPGSHPWKKWRKQKRHIKSNVLSIKLSQLCPSHPHLLYSPTLMQPLKAQIKLIYFWHCLSCIYKYRLNQ
jgi:hypothetical protein